MKAPALFLAHGSPMNAIERNGFADALAQLGRRVPRPEAVVCVSAHWLTRGTWVTGMERPRTIHDFHGFPRELFEIQYPAPGSPALARRIAALEAEPPIGRDDSEWGLDHGTWSVLKHVFPAADVPVVQLSIDLRQPPRYHYEMGKRLARLRAEGVLIVGSGNVVHNLRQIRWEPEAEPFGWALEFDRWVRDRLARGDDDSLMDYPSAGEPAKLSAPTPDHFYPLFYVLGARDGGETPRFEYEGIQHGSVSMLSVSYGLSG